jgi:predicted nucleotidyltransferase component of viral defense system
MIAILEERLKKYSPQTLDDEQDALKEILQEIILYGLSNVGFFEKAVFQGGTSLRIFHNLSRFSEDLDFILKKPDPEFKWQPYLDAITRVCKQYGIIPEVIDRSETSKAVKKMFIKDCSIVKVLNLSFKHHPEQKLTIKLEIDTNPPEGSNSEIQHLKFPLIAAVEVQDLPSNLAGKSHALLCRKFTKGRDWYDFLWYYSKDILPNFNFLTNAINQTGPWAEQNIIVTPDWYFKALKEKIKTINWQEAIKDIMPFLGEQDKKTLRLWNEEFFQNIINKFSTFIT